MTSKKEVTAMLRRYDKLRHELRTLEHTLNRSCAEYGRNHLGIWGYTKDHLRMQLERENPKKENVA